jgi:hypothetical protein
VLAEEAFLGSIGRRVEPLSPVLFSILRPLVVTSAHLARQGLLGGLSFPSGRRVSNLCLEHRLDKPAPSVLLAPGCIAQHSRAPAPRISCSSGSSARVTSCASTISLSCTLPGLVFPSGRWSFAPGKASFLSCKRVFGCWSPAHLCDGFDTRWSLGVASSHELPCAQESPRPRPSHEHSGLLA